MATKWPLTLPSRCFHLGLRRSPKSMAEKYPIFMLWKLKSRMTFLSKGWWHFPCQASLEKLDLTGRHQEKSLQEDTLLVFPLYLSFFGQRRIRVLALLHLHFTGLSSSCINNIMPNFWLPNANEDRLSIKKFWVCVLVRRTFCWRTSFIQISSTWEYCEGKWKIYGWREKVWCLLVSFTKTFWHSHTAY